MKRTAIMSGLLAVVLLSAAACAGNADSRENRESVSDTEEQGQPEERAEEKDQEGGVRGDSNGVSDGAGNDGHDDGREGDHEGVTDDGREGGHDGARDDGHNGVPDDGHNGVPDDGREGGPDSGRDGAPEGGRDGAPNGNRGGQDSAPDEELQAILDEVQDKYQLLTFTDPDTGFEMQYELFVPESYDASESYPMVMFIPDSRAAGREAEFSLTVGWGGVIWATAEEQAKHPCFVLIPVFTETIVDDNFNTSSQIEVAVNLIHDLCGTYSIDTDRIYATGQSMGGMTSFHLNVAYPDLFAASLFVGSQWNNEILDVLEDDKFFYIVSAGDDKASTGQKGLMAVFDADGVPYTHREWSAQEDRDVQEASVEAMIAEGLQANFVTFTKGTTVAGGASGSEHLTSFDYAYKLEAVRDWLFAQSR